MVPPVNEFSRGYSVTKAGGPNVLLGRVTWPTQGRGLLCIAGPLWVSARGPLVATKTPMGRQVDQYEIDFEVRHAEVLGILPVAATYTSATSRSKFGFFSAWSFRATPQTVAIRSSILSECPEYSASSRRAITDCVVPTFLASSV